MNKFNHLFKGIISMVNFFYFSLSLFSKLKSLLRKSCHFSFPAFPEITISVHAFWQTTNFCQAFKFSFTNSRFVYYSLNGTLVVSFLPHLQPVVHYIKFSLKKDWTKSNITINVLSLQKNLRRITKLSWKKWLWKV